MYTCFHKDRDGLITSVHIHIRTYNIHSHTFTSMHRQTDRHRQIHIRTHTHMPLIWGLIEAIFHPCFQATFHMVPQTSSILLCRPSIRPNPFTCDCGKALKCVRLPKPFYAACKLATISVIQSYAPHHHCTDTLNVRMYFGGKLGPIVFSSWVSTKCHYYKQTQSNAHFHSSRVIYIFHNKLYKQWQQYKHVYMPGQRFGSSLRHTIG